MSTGRSLYLETFRWMLLARTLEEKIANLYRAKSHTLSIILSIGIGLTVLIALLQVEGETPQVLHAGQAFYEPAMTRILHFDNHSDTRPLLFVAFYLLNGRQSLIEFIYE